MKAIRIYKTGDPGVMVVEEVPGLFPAAGQVVVRLQSIGVNPVDTYIRAGAQGYDPALPCTPGMDGAGLVEAVGSDVDGIREGDRVYIAGSLSGTYAEQALCKANQVHALPGRLSFRQGAAVNVPYVTAWRALFQRAHAAPGERVLIHGASGGVGLAAVQLARAAGLEVYGTAGTDQGRRLVEEQGAVQVFDHHDPLRFEQMIGATADEGMNVILEMLANENLGDDLGLLAFGGRVVVIGSQDTVTINPRDAMSREAAILGMSLFKATESDLRMIHASLAAGLREGTLKPVTGKEFSLERAADAHRAVMAPGSPGKIVLNP